MIHISTCVVQNINAASHSNIKHLKPEITTLTRECTVFVSEDGWKQKFNSKTHYS